MLRIRAITLTELIVVVVIIAVLLALGTTLYTKTLERGRTAEAKAILGFLRSAEEGHKLEYNTYSSSFTAIGAQDVVQNCSQGTHYFMYSLTNISATTFTAKAERCTTGGKSPSGKEYYAITLNQDGVLTVPAGY